MFGLPCQPLALPLYFVFIWRSDLAPCFRGENSLLPFEPQDQYLQRQKKLAEIEARGHDAYPHKFDWTATPAELAEKYASADAAALEASKPPVRVAGRIVALRLHGKAGFAHISGSGQRLQIYVKLDIVGPRAFELFQMLDLGDFVGLNGRLFRTKTGELTVWVSELPLLSKALLPLPEKWHGLSDVEVRYRQRYLDLIANERARGIFLRRAHIIRELRRFFDARGYIEVETPMMQAIPGGAAARPFVTHHNTLDVDLYLRIAPELYLKRLTVGGLDRVYEINRNFRNEGLGWRWNPEFTMLEFYQAYTDYRGVMDLTQQLIEQAAKDVTGGTKAKWGEEEIDWADSNWRRMTMREAVVQHWPEAAGAKPQMSDFASSKGVENLVKRFNSAHAHVAYDPKEPSGKTIAALFEAAAQEHLAQPTIIYEFPTAVSPLSKQKPDEPEWTERWEIFGGKMEIANGFSELNDPEDQRRRFEQQLKERQRGDEEAHQMDEDYIRALSYGMPPAGGVGVGVDRLCMLLTDSHTIRDVILFPLLRPEKSLTTEGTEGNA